MRHALLLAGGQGRRFWPKSRTARPKQFMPFDGKKSLLRATAERLVPVVPFARQWVVTHRDYVDLVRKELPEVPAAHVIGEPKGLNTGPAVALAAALMREEDANALMVVQAADHWIRDVQRFRALVGLAFRTVETAQAPALLIGFRPVRPATGYGYIALGARRPAPKGFRLFDVAGYKEKPSAATARRYLASGRYLWNGCMFFWHARTILTEVDRHLPQLARALNRALARRIAGPRGLDAAVTALYARLEPVLIEHGVVEKLADKVALEGDCGWEDVGTWESLGRLLPADADGNVVQGLHAGCDTRRTFVIADRGVVATLGVSDLIVVRDGDAVLVLPRSREGEIRDLVAALQADPRLRRFL